MFFKNTELLPWDMKGHTFKVGPNFKKNCEVRGPLDFAASFLDHLGLGGPNSWHRALSPRGWRWWSVAMILKKLVGIEVKQMPKYLKNSGLAKTCIPILRPQNTGSFIQTSSSPWGIRPNKKGLKTQELKLHSWPRSLTGLESNVSFEEQHFSWVGTLQ